MVLHAEAPFADHLETLADTVVEVDVGHPDGLAERAQRVGVDREVVVLAGDLDRSVDQVHHRVIAAVVPERQLDRAGAERQPEQLMTEADPEHGHVTDQPCDLVGGVLHHRRVAGAVREEHPVGSAGEDIGSGRRCRNHLDPAEP